MNHKKISSNIKRFFMKKLFSLLLILLLIVPAESQVHNFEINGQTRQYYFFLPNSLPANSPLVFVLHGYSDSATSIKNYSGMNQIANVNGFAVCYPQGTTDQWNNRFWQVGYDFHKNNPVDDVEFLTALAQYLQNEHNLSSQKTFCTGMSNGGDMCYLLACQASEVFSAVAPVAGCMMKWIYDSCNPTNPIPLFEIHGTKDNITYWNGVPNNNQGYGAYLNVPAAIDLWVQQNNCTQSVIDTLPNINHSDGSIVVREKYFKGINNNEVWLYKIINGGHNWPGNWGNKDINASEEIWKFFNLAIQNATNVREEKENQIANVSVLYQNYPNPFNPITTISYNLLEETFVNITIYDILGREIFRLVNSTQQPGLKSVQWDATDSQGKPVSAGLYQYKIKAGKFVQIRKMVVLK